MIDGQINHDWRTTTPIMKKALEDCGRFTVDVSSNLKPNDKPGTIEKTIRDGEHPITMGMPKQWMHASDELYDNMRGPIKNVHLLATAYSKGTKAHEPLIWTVDYGKGRVFHTPMGHGADSMRCVGFSTTLQRGTEWAATAKVTLKIPENFPTEEKTSSLAK